MKISFKILQIFLILDWIFLCTALMKVGKEICVYMKRLCKIQQLYLKSQDERKRFCTKTINIF